MKWSWKIMSAFCFLNVLGKTEGHCIFLFLNQYLSHISSSFHIPPRRLFVRLPQTSISLSSKFLQPQSHLHFLYSNRVNPEMCPCITLSSLLIFLWVLSAVCYSGRQRRKKGSQTFKGNWISVISAILYLALNNLFSIENRNNSKK